MNGRTGVLLGSAIISSLLTGCAGKLVVFDDQQKEIAGMPFRAAEVFVKVGLKNALAKGGDCKPTPFVDVVSLPTGSMYYVAAHTASFAKTAFHIKYNDSGAVSEVGLDSEPAAAETLKAVAELYKVIRPAPAAAAAAAEEARRAPSALPACDSGEAEVTFTKLEAYQKAHPGR